MIKIFYFITDLGIGGAEKLLVSILSKLDKNKYLPVVCCLYGGELLNRIRELNIKVIDLKVKSKLDFSALLKLYCLLKQEGPDIIHTHLFHATIIGRIIARFAGVPIIISTQHYSSSFHGRLGMLADKLTAPLTDQIIAVSGAVKKFCVEEEGITSTKVRIIYNGIDLNSNSHDKGGLDLKKQLFLGNEPIIGTVGRFVEIKGYKYLFYAAKDIIKQYPNVKFILLGYGPLKNKLTKLTIELGLSDKVIFLDPAIKVTDFLSILDVYVLPSLSEGLSITLLEAMAMSKPVVVTNVGGNPEVVKDCETGLMVPARDPNSLSKAIISILKDRNFALKMALNARRRVEEKFNIDNMIMDTELVYDSLVDSNIKASD